MSCCQSRGTSYTAASSPASTPGLPHIMGTAAQSPAVPARPSRSGRGAPNLLLCLTARESLPALPARSREAAAGPVLSTRSSRKTHASRRRPLGTGLETSKRREVRGDPLSSPAPDKTHGKRKIQPGCGTAPAPLAVPAPRFSVKRPPCPGRDPLWERGEGGHDASPKPAQLQGGAGPASVALS